MKKILIISALIMSLTACKDEVDTKDVGAGSSTADAVTNFPVGWVYVEYPTVYTDADTYIYSQGPCEMGELNPDGSVAVGVPLAGMWMDVQDYNGAFFRSEGGEAFEFEQGEASNLVPEGLLQGDSLQAHRHGVGQTGFGINHTEVAGGNVGIDYYAWGGNIDEASYGTVGGRTLKHTTADEKDLTDDSVKSSTTGATNTFPRIAAETRPVNYTMKMWKKIASYGSCFPVSKSYETKYNEVKTIKKDKTGNILSVDTKKVPMSRKAKIDSDGNPIYRSLNGDMAEIYTLSGKRITITTMPDTEILLKKIEIVEIVK